MLLQRIEAEILDRLPLNESLELSDHISNNSHIIRESEINNISINEGLINNIIQKLDEIIPDCPDKMKKIKYIMELQNEEFKQDVNPASRNNRGPRGKNVNNSNNSLKNLLDLSIEKGHDFVQNVHESNLNLSRLRGSRHSNNCSANSLGNAEENKESGGGESANINSGSHLIQLVESCL